MQTTSTLINLFEGCLYFNRIAAGAEDLRACNANNTFLFTT